MGRTEPIADRKHAGCEFVQGRDGSSLRQEAEEVQKSPHLRDLSVLDSKSPFSPATGENPVK